MHYRTTLLSSGRISKAAVLLLVVLFGVGTMLAANSGPAPVLVPFTITSLGGNTQTTTGGFGGDGGPATAATFNAPSAIAVDTQGNVYFSDLSSDVIREINAQTGLVSIVAGVAPTKCTGTTCTTTASGCSDGVPALGNPTGVKIGGMAVDGYGNLYFDDGSYQGVWVVYKGGKQVASFITLVDPTGVSSAGGVLPGYVYHIAGNAVTKGTGATGCTDSATVAATTIDNVLATSTTTAFHNPGQMSLDLAGNIYINDTADDVIRVVNTQATTQTFFGTSVAPGYMRAILGCTAVTAVSWTIPCTGLNAAAFGTPAVDETETYPGDATSVQTDQYNNVYIMATKGATYIYDGVAYAGGTALANLIALESGPTSTPLETPLTATPGNWYEVVDNLLSVNALYSTTPAAVVANQSNNIIIRPTSQTIDAQGDIWFIDNHWPGMFRTDINSMVITRIFDNNVYTTGTTATPAYCTATATSGPLTYDKWGDGCPVSDARIGTGGTGQMAFDGVGNLYYTDTSAQLVRKISVNTQFPATAVGTPISQTLQIHFDQNNLPILPAGVVPSATATTTTSFQIAPGSPDFSLSTTTPANSLYPSPVSCVNITTGFTGQATTAVNLLTQQLDNSIECYLNVTFQPVGPGLRSGTLQVSTANGSVYNFALTGSGVGGQVSVDGGLQATISATGLGKASAVAASQSGTLYIADPTNNRVVVEPAGGGPQTAIGTGLKGPMGVAVDAAGDVFISDTGNNRIVEVAAITGSQTVLGQVPGGPSNGTGALVYTPYPFNGPQGIALDPFGNLYVADTGNKQVVVVPPAFLKLAPSPLLQYSGAPTFVNPVAVATDATGNVYVADTGNSNGILKIRGGGGDLIPSSGTTSLVAPTSLIGFGAAQLSKPNGIALDAAGDLYVSDSTLNEVVEISASTGPGSAPFALSFTGLSSPAGVAVDPSGNVYLADSGNSRILLDNRSLTAASFGQVSLYAPGGTLPLTVTNTGSGLLTPTSPFASITGANAGDFAETDTCGVSNFTTGVLGQGLHCAVNAVFTPIAGGNRTATLSLENGAATAAISGTGVPPLASLVITVGSTQTGGLIAGNTATVNVVASQPNGTKATPTGTVTFNYTIDGVAGSSAALPLVNGAVSYNLPTLLLGRQYTVTAAYSGDGLDSPTTSATQSFYVQGLPVTVVAPSVSYVYGGTVPVLTGTVTGLLPADVANGLTYTFTTTATPSSNVGTFPITVVFSGANYQNYGFPTVYTDSTQKTVSAVTETQAPLTFTIGNYSLSYGEKPDDDPVLNATGGAWAYTQSALVNGDQLLTPTFTPAFTSTLAVGSYTVVPTLSIPTKSGYDKINNYKLNVTNGILTIVKEVPILTINPPSTVVFPTGLTAAPITIKVAPSTSTYFGTPSGTVTLTDVFTPLTATGPGPAITSTIGPLTLVGGSITYPQASATLGVHAITGVYNGDSNFTTATALAPNMCQYATTNSTICYEVDNQDYTVTSTTTPVQIVPGTVPGGSGTNATENSAFPQTATVTLAPVLGFTGALNLSCASPVSYLTCSIVGVTGTYSATTTYSANQVVIYSSLYYVSLVSSNLGNEPDTSPASWVQLGFGGTPPTTVTLTATASQSAVLSMQTPATLPANFTSELRGPGSSKALWAFLPLGILAFIPLGLRSRRKLGRILWMLLALAAVSAGTGACGNNTLKFFTPVPAGPLNVTVTATGTSPTNGAALSRTFTVPVAIQ
jgi:sugar lactone lactonase YvrE